MYYKYNIYKCLIGLISVLIHFLNLIIWSWRFSDGKVGIQVTGLISDFQFWDRSSQQVNSLLLMCSNESQSLTWLRRSLIGITFTDLLLYLSSESLRKVNHGESLPSHDPAETCRCTIWKRNGTCDSDNEVFQAAQKHGFCHSLNIVSSYRIFSYKHRSSKDFSFNIKVKLLCIIIERYEVEHSRLSFEFDRRIQLNSCRLCMPMAWRHYQWRRQMIKGWFWN